MTHFLFSAGEQTLNPDEKRRVNDSLSPHVDECSIQPSRRRRVSAEQQINSRLFAYVFC